MVLLIHGRHDALQSESSQAEACEFDRYLRAVVLRDAP
jgi:hypothetical protein